MAVTCTGLQGMKEITNYMNLSAATILNYVRDLNFPAKKAGGIWQSDIEEIEQWRKRFVRGEHLENPSKKKKGVKKK